MLFVSTMQIGGAAVVVLFPFSVRFTSLFIHLAHDDFINCNNNEIEQQQLRKIVVRPHTSIQCPAVSLPPERAQKRAHFNWFIHRPQKVLMLHILLPFHIKFNTSTELMSEIYDRRYQLRHTRFNFFPIRYCVRSIGITCFSARSLSPCRIVYGVYKYMHRR